MESMLKTLNEAVPSINMEDGDYLDSDGFVLCGQCHTRRQRDYEVRAMQTIKRLTVPCECRKAAINEKYAAIEHDRFAERMELLRRDGITDPGYLRLTFDSDDRRNPVISDTCKKYVDNWAEMYEKNVGILFYGSVGTGKSFLACCIANALLERLTPVCVTNFPRILDRLQSFDEKKRDFVDKMQRYALLVIDDLGVERDTSYVAEQIYNVVDTRARAGKPTIITTNLTVDELEKPSSMEYKRIYDRVLEMCPIQLKMDGESRRVGNADERRQFARQVMGGKVKT